MEKFSHMIPPTMIPILKQNNIFSLGLLEKKGDQFHPAGIIITQIEEDMAELLWIYVSPQIRNQGAGYQLLHSTIEILKLEKHIKTLMVFLEPDSSYLYYFLFFGFDPALSHPGKLYETSINGLANGKLGNVPLLPNIVSFHDLTPLSLKRFNALTGTKKLTSDMIAFPLEKEDYLPCSMAIVESGDITDLLLFAEDEDNTGISQIMSVTIPSHINDVKRCHTANNTVDTLLTPEEMQRLQQSTLGIRGGDGTCLTQRTKPMTNPMCAGMAEMFDQLKAENFNFKEALFDMKEIPYATKPIKFNEATIAMSLKALKYTMSYLQNEHVQEYIKTVYESFGKVLLDNVRNKTNNPNALPTDDDMDNHALEVLYTRGFDVLTPIRFNASVSQEAKDFAIYTSALLGKMAHLNECVKTCGNNDYINMLTPLVEQIAIFKNTMSQIGAEVRTKRLNEMKNNLQ